MGWVEAHERAVEFAESLDDLGDVTVSRLFGGAAIRVNGLAFAFVMGDILYGRTDPSDIEYLKGRGLRPFQFTKSNGQVTMTSYYEAPAEVIDEPERLRAWARRALDAAVAADRRKGDRPRRSRE